MTDEDYKAMQKAALKAYDVYFRTKKAEIKSRIAAETAQRIAEATRIAPVAAIASIAAQRKMQRLPPLSTRDLQIAAAAATTAAVQKVQQHMTEKAKRAAQNLYAQPKLGGRRTRKLSRKRRGHGHGRSRRLLK
jgi:predicted aspartyl protease